MTAPSAPDPASERPATLRLARADIGFSAAHFSVIDGVPERLHGHNYRVTLEAHGSVRTDGTVIDFHALKRVLRDVCSELDERMLIAAESPAMSVSEAGGAVTVDVAAQRYVLPSGDVRLLPINNTTCECLAAHLLRAVRESLGPVLVQLSLGVEELPGQGAVIQE